MTTCIKIIGCLLVVIAISNCTRHEKEVKFSDYKPVLMESDKVTTDLILLPAKESKSITQMHTIGNYLLALEYGLGLHIIDITDPNNPVKKGFYQIPACIDFEVNNNLIYANNFRDFIVVEFSDINNPIISKREKGAFDIVIKTLDGLRVHDKLKDIPANTTIISYEKI